MTAARGCKDGMSGAVRRIGLGALALASLLSGCATTPEIEPDAPLYYPPPPETPRFVHEFTLRRASDVEVETEVDSLRRRLTGEGVDQAVFNKPFDISARSGRIYVTDSMEGLVHAFDVPTRRYWRFGYRLEGDLGKPAGIAQDRAGNVYVADTRRKEVVVYDNLGLFRNAIGADAELSQPVAVDVSADGSRIYVVDAGGVASDRHRIAVFDDAGNFLDSIGERGAAPGQFNLPADIAVGPDHNLYVLDAGNFRVQVIDPEGRPLRQWGSVGSAFGQFARPRSLLVSDQGLVMVADTMFGNIQIFDADGSLLLPLGASSGRDERGRFGLLAGIATDETGRLYAVDQLHRKVEIFRYLAQ